MRAVLVLVVLAPLVLAGCSQPAPRAEPAGAEPMLLAIDGRWPVPTTSLAALLRDAAWPDAAGAALFGQGIARAGNATLALDFAALDAGAARAADPTGALDPVAPGEVALNGSWARAHAIAVGDAIALSATTFPKPLVTGAYEMERVRPCDKSPAGAPICFLPNEGNRIALRIVLGADAQDLAFVPEGTELGPGGLPAWWNGSFVSPAGARIDFGASLDEAGRAVPAEMAGPVAPGNWTVSFRLESARHSLDGGIAGVVRFRAPGYSWFDDRLASDPDGANETRTLLASGASANATLRVARLVERGIPAAQALVAVDDARRLVGAREGEATGLVVVASRDLLPQLSDARNRTTDPVQAVARARPLPHDAPTPAPRGSALVFRAPPGIDVASLPAVGALDARFLAAELPMPVGETAAVEGKPVASLRLLAFGGPGAPPWSLPTPGRWTNASAALENVTRSRTLVLASSDWLAGGQLTARLALGDARVGRVAVVVESVDGGPAAVAWASASFVAGAGKPTGAVVVAPLAAGTDPADAAVRAQAAWGPLGLALD